MTSTQTTEKTMMVGDIYGKYYQMTEAMIEVHTKHHIPLQVEKGRGGEWVGNQAWNDLTNKLGWSLPLYIPYKEIQKAKNPSNSAENGSPVPPEKQSYLK